MSGPTVVLLPGACHGAWWFAPAVDALTARGHRALAVTDRLRTDPTWTVHDLPTTHNVLDGGPDVLVGLVEEVLADVAAR